MFIKIKKGRIIADLCCKPTDDNQYFHYDSCPADHIKRSIAYSQTLRLKRICSKRNDLITHVEDLKKWFRKRDYPDDFLDNPSFINLPQVNRKNLHY